MKRTCKVLTALLLILSMVLLPALVSCNKDDPAETEAGTGTGTGAPDETEPPETEPPIVIPETPNHDVIMSIGDQTGHPENSAEKVDVDALLKYDANFNTKEEYKVRYRSSGKRVKDENAPVGLIKTEYPTSTNIVAVENVRAYGAMGNGTTDDTSAIKAAIRAASEKGGGVVFLPAGYYCLNGSISLPMNVGLVGELEPGTANGTVICVYSNKGKEGKLGTPAVSMSMHSAIRNVAFWYPEQTIVNGRAIPYPPTVRQTGSEGVTLENVTFVNSYFAIDYAYGGDNNSLQYTRDIYGTPLSVGYENDKSFDIGKVENMNFSADYWLNSGLPGTPNADLLRAYLLKYATGMIIERIDWTYYADVTIDGYKIGVHARSISNGPANGSMYNFKLLNCKTCFGAEALNWMVITDSVLTAVGSDGVALKIANAAGNVTLNSCTLKSEGDNAASIKGGAIVTFSDCTIESKGKEAVNASETKVRLLNCTVSSTSKVVYEDDSMPELVRADYSRTVVCKPASDKFIDLSQPPYSVKGGSDATKKLQEAIDSLKETGGTVFLPAGSYKLSDRINVWAGIEIRGAQYWPQNGNAVTNFNTNYGEKDEKGEALFTLYDGAGMVGIGVYYPKLDTSKVAYAYTIRGNGKNIYLIDISLPTTWNGVDFDTYRCDNHYIEYIHAAVMASGVKVGGGSENGIVRDCHFTPNCFILRSKDSWWSDVYTILMRMGKTFVVNESKNEILYHNFTYGAHEGLSLGKGAKDVYVLCHGVDAGDVPIHIANDATATIVNAQLVNLNSSTNVLVDAVNSFTGEVNFFNYAGWGTPTTAFRMKGDGTLNVVGGITSPRCEPLFDISAGHLGVYATVYVTANVPVRVVSKAKSLVLSANAFGRKGSYHNKLDTCDISGTDEED